MPRTKQNSKKADGVPTKAKDKVKGKETKKPRRFRPGTVARRLIIRYQRSTKPLIPGAPFERLVRSLSPEKRFTKAALVVLREAAEERARVIFASAADCARHANHNTVTPKDIALATRMVTL